MNKEELREVKDMLRKAVKLGYDGYQAHMPLEIIQAHLIHEFNRIDEEREKNANKKSKKN